MGKLPHQREFVRASRLVQPRDLPTFRAFSAGIVVAPSLVNPPFGNRRRICAEREAVMNTMKAVVCHGVNDSRVEEVARPRPNAGEAVIRVTATTICGTDVHIVKGEYPVRPGLILGHEPVGVIEELGEGLGDDYTVGQRVIAGAITPCGQCFYCLNGVHSQCRGALGGWRFGNTINGAWAEYLLVPDARAN